MANRILQFIITAGSAIPFATNLCGREIKKVRSQLLVTCFFSVEFQFCILVSSVVGILISGGFGVESI